MEDSTFIPARGGLGRCPNPALYRRSGSKDVGPAIGRQYSILLRSRHVKILLESAAYHVEPLGPRKTRNHAVKMEREADKAGSDQVESGVTGFGCQPTHAPGLLSDLIPDGIGRQPSP